MIFITDEADIIYSENIIALYFYADWLYVHKKMQIMIKKVEENNSMINFYAIDINNFKKLCTRYEINSIPTIVVLNDKGKEIKRIVGITLTSAFKNAFTDIYSSCKEKKEKKT